MTSSPGESMRLSMPSGRWKPGLGKYSGDVGPKKMAQIEPQASVAKEKDQS